MADVLHLSHWLIELKVQLYTSISNSTVGRLESSLPKTIISDHPYHFCIDAIIDYLSNIER